MQSIKYEIFMFYPLIIQIITIILFIIIIVPIDNGNLTLATFQCGNSWPHLLPIESISCNSSFS